MLSEPLYICYFLEWWVMVITHCPFPMVCFSSTTVEVTFVLQLNACACVHTHSCPMLCNLMDYSPSGSSVHVISQNKNTGMGCHFLLQRIFPTQGSNSCLLQSPALDSYHFCYLGSLSNTTIEATWMLQLNEQSLAKVFSRMTVVIWQNKNTDKMKLEKREIHLSRVPLYSIITDILKD